MLKLTAVILSITMFVTGTMNAQTVAVSSQNAPDLKEAFSRESEKLKSESAEIDFKKLEKASRQTPQKNWNKKNTLIIGGIIGALVVLAVVLALTTKRCVKRSPSNCNFAEDTNCQCLEYAE